MRLLAPAVVLMVAFVVLGAGVSAFGEPIVFDDGTVRTAILMTPEFEVDTSEFSETGEIILDVKFHNPTTKKSGINWAMETPNDGLDDPDEVYKKYSDERRFYIYILNQNGEKLDIDGMTVTSNDDFILPHGTTEKYDDRYVVEVLDIDELVEFLKVGAKIETQLRLSSPEFVGGEDYELKVWTFTKFEHNPMTFTLPTIQETSAPEPTPSEIIQSGDDSKEIPKWVKDIFGFYYKGEIGDEELIGALQYLIKNKIIEI